MRIRSPLQSVFSTVGCDARQLQLPGPGNAPYDLDLLIDMQRVVRSIGHDQPPQLNPTAAALDLRKPIASTYRRRRMAARSTERANARLAAKGWLRRRYRGI